jgi:preprotein translocase subunit YajC
MEGIGMNEHCFKMIMAQADTTQSGAAPATPAASPTPTADPGQQTTTTAPGEQPAPTDVPPKSKLLDNPLLLMGLMLVVLYLFMFRGPRKKQQQHKQMLDNMKKNDRVRTIGGILGTVADVRGDEVVIKVDESNNTKIRVIRSAIGEVYAENQSES